MNEVGIESDRKSNECGVEWASDSRFLRYKEMVNECRLNLLV